MEERYYSLDTYLKQTYGEKLYKISLNAGLTCPNRDGTLDRRGCIFCSAGGSGDFAADPALSIPAQIEAGKAQVKRKLGKKSADVTSPQASGTTARYIAYFQAYTNTYGPVEYLRQIFTEAIASPDVRILSIATRPDCLGPEVLDLLAELARQKPVWVELGLQTIHEDTAAFIRRDYELPVFEEAVRNLRALGIPVIVHTILCLPGEDKEKNLETIGYLNRQDIQGIKLQLLHILKGTDLADLYAAHPFPVPSMEEYFDLLGCCLNHLRPDIVVHRLTGDGPKSLLIEPKWTGNKKQVLNGMHRYFETHDIRQGKDVSL